MNTLLQAHFLHYDPLFLGMGRRGLANAMHATLGQLFPRPGGGSNLYRGRASAEQNDRHDPGGGAGSKDRAMCRSVRKVSSPVGVSFKLARMGIYPALVN